MRLVSVEWYELRHTHIYPKSKQGYSLDWARWRAGTCNENDYLSGNKWPSKQDYTSKEDDKKVTHHPEQKSQ